MLNVFYSLVKKLEEFCSLLSVIFFSTLTLVMVYAILNRNIFHHPGMWVIELSGILLVWFAFTSAASAIPVFGNIKIPVLILKLPLEKRRYALIFIYILSLAFTVSFFIVSIPLVVSGWESKILTLHSLPYFWAYLSLSFGSGAMSLSILKLIVKFINHEEIENYK